jgi:hypothetical protein
MSLSRPIKSLFRGADDLEHRGESRGGCAAATCCRVLDPPSGRSWPAAIRDIAITGISFWVGRQFEIGRLLTIELENAERGFARKYLVEVRHAEICSPNDAWLLGCRFTARPLHDEELRLLL